MIESWFKGVKTKMQYECKSLTKWEMVQTSVMVEIWDWANQIGFLSETEKENQKFYGLL